jgi:NAD(P)-dependent dehydrogenase (short-subunit alcohol dehydrogenase family)
MADLPAVVVTGASTGIGASCALRLAQQGYHVFAGVRKPEDGERLRQRSAGLLEWLPLDVTDGATIARAAETVASAQGEHGLAGLVNNAGIAVGGPLEYLSTERLRRQFEVNVVGLHAVTQAFIPLIRRARGRIVHIGSIAGRIASPFTGAYAASKHAVEALTDALRLELAPEGIHVSVIEPGQIKTPIWDKGLQEFSAITSQIPAEGMARYRGRLMALRHILDRARARAASPEAVADAVLHALNSPEPRTRYVVGGDARLRLWLTRLLPDRALDMVVLRALAHLERKVS